MGAVNCGVPAVVDGEGILKHALQAYHREAVEAGDRDVAEAGVKVADGLGGAGRCLVVRPLPGGGCGRRRPALRGISLVVLVEDCTGVEPRVLPEHAGLYRHRRRWEVALEGDARVRGWAARGEGAVAGDGPGLVSCKRRVVAEQRRGDLRKVRQESAMDEPMRLVVPRTAVAI